MCHLFESIRVENGALHHLAYHEQRMQRAQRALWGRITLPALVDSIAVPSRVQQGLFKCRVTYRQTIEHIEFVPYQPKTIRTLRCVHCDDIDYRHKYQDRQPLNELFAQRGTCDDILIIKEGRVTDTSYGNIVFYDGQRWVTPDQPLLRGTQREYLLDQSRIRSVLVTQEDIAHFHSFQVINALRAFADAGRSTSYIQ